MTLTFGKVQPKTVFIQDGVHGDVTELLGLQSSMK